MSILTFVQLLIFDKAKIHIFAESLDVSMNLFLGKQELNYLLEIQEKGLSNCLGLKKKGGYPLWTAAFPTYSL